MGQKINPIALRLGGRIDWNEKSISRTRFRNKPQKYFYRNKLITYVVKGVLKSFNILVSELIIKDKISSAPWPLKGPCSTACSTACSTGCSKARIGTMSTQSNKELKNTSKLYKISDLTKSNTSSQKIIEISGLIYKPLRYATSRKSNFHRDNTRYTSDQQSDKELNKDMNKFDVLIEKSKLSRSQSYRTKIILDEFNSLIAKLIKSYLINEYYEKDLEIRFNWTLISSPLVNSDILSDWIELSLIESSRVMNDRKIFKWLFD